MSELGFERAQAAETGRPGYDPRDLLKLYLYGYLNQIRSWRRWEVECLRNVELMWLLGRVYPDHKSMYEGRKAKSIATSVRRSAGANDEAGDAGFDGPSKVYRRAPILDNQVPYLRAPASFIAR